ncbi:hypothetical protein [Massilia sp. TS11]|uniref:hypothetical protein n=1 Tax=Massilia sp. TS11 TaxID=2908003 RepID=UPI001EDA1991|nr:hypothetical protein [Massilia sp. TS11]MCG2583900.1 hypothetical protein [Massilia sp. TS11]
MDAAIHFTEVQFLNHLILNAIRASILRDPIAAGYLFHLTPEEARKLAEMPQEQLQSLVASNSHEFLFAPRASFARALDLPPDLLPAILTVQQHGPATAEPARTERRKSQSLEMAE